MQCAEDLCVEILQNMKLTNVDSRNVQHETEWTEIVAGSESMLIRTANESDFIVHVVRVSGGVHIIQISIMNNLTTSRYFHGFSILLTREYFFQVLEDIFVPNMKLNKLTSHVYKIYQRLCKKGIMCLNT